MATYDHQTPEILIPRNGFVIEFPDVSPAQAGIFAEEMETDLRNKMLDAKADAAVERIRVDPEAQDLGTVLGIVLGAQATVAIAKGIQKWLHRNNQATIRIRTKTGNPVVISNLESRDVKGILEELTSMG